MEIGGRVSRLLCVVLGHARMAGLVECHLVHVLKQFVLLDQLVLKHHNSGVYLAVLVP